MVKKSSEKKQRLKIAQISDIHIGGDYDGKFDVVGNFEAVLASLPSDIGLLVLSGDLADKDYLKNYEYIRDSIRDAQFRMEDPFLLAVTAGNHDDVDALAEVFADSYAGKSMNVSLMGNEVTLIDTHDGVVDVGELAMSTGSVLFTHYPIMKVRHEFMGKHSLRNMAEAEEALDKSCLRYLFCGHFHSAVTVVSGEKILRVCPSTQCQIDAVNEEFSVSSMTPAYHLIEMCDGEVVNCQVVEVPVDKRTEDEEDETPEPRYVSGDVFSALLISINASGITDSRLEKALSLDKGYVGRLRKEGSSLPVDFALMRILSAYPLLVRFAENGYEPVSKE